MLVQVVINNPGAAMYDLRLPPGRYRARVTAIQLKTAAAPAGVFYQLESLIFRQLHGTNQYLTVLDDMSKCSYDRSGTWEFDWQGAMPITVTRLDGGANDLQRMSIFLDVEPVVK